MIIQRTIHSISYKKISNNALKTLSHLHKNGFKAYLVGGSVRDLLLGKKPKDFDLTTNATPDQVRKIFRNCRLIGRRFRLAHIIFDQETIEVSTFRGNYQNRKLNKYKKKIQEDSLIDSNGILLRDNIFGSIEEDAQRRDFSINSLYYSTVDFSLRDYTGGLKDLKEGVIKVIGDPEKRYREDPVRMLRAIRFSAKLNMKISHYSAEPIPVLAILLNNVSSSRLFEESLKLFQNGFGAKTYELLCKYQLFQFLFPLISQNFTKSKDSYTERMIVKVLKNTDQRLKKKLRINPAFLFSAILWYILLEKTTQLINKRGFSYFNAFSFSMSDLLAEQSKTLTIPKRLILLIKEVWKLQLRLICWKNKRIHKLINHPKFRAAYDLLILRSEIENDNELKFIVKWWKEFQSSHKSTYRAQHTEFHYI